jgi:hypothetical protein
MIAAMLVSAPLGDSVFFWERAYNDYLDVSLCRGSRHSAFLDSPKTMVPV